jgi:hypothetical protein
MSKPKPGIQMKAGKGFGHFLIRQGTNYQVSGNFLVNSDYSNRVP